MIIGMSRGHGGPKKQADNAQEAAHDAEHLCRECPVACARAGRGDIDEDILQQWHWR
jgi:hypothetical protein